MNHSLTAFFRGPRALLLRLGHVPWIECFGQGVLGQNLLSPDRVHGWFDRWRMLPWPAWPPVRNRSADSGSCTSTSFVRQPASHDSSFASISSMQKSTNASMPLDSRWIDSKIVCGHHRHHDVQLKIAARGAADRHAGVVADHARGQLHHRFAHHRIDFARHDRAARLATGQLDFVETTARTAAEPANVVGNVEQAFARCTSSSPWD